MTQHTVQSLAQRLAAIEAALAAAGIMQPEPQPEPEPPKTIEQTFTVYDIAEGLKQQIAADEAELVAAIAEVELWQRGEHPEFPHGPKSNFTPHLVRRPDLLRRQIAEWRARLDQVEGRTRRFPPQRR